MRPKEKIIHDTERAYYGSETHTKLLVELLLDIRELLFQMSGRIATEPAP